MEKTSQPADYPNHGLHHRLQQGDNLILPASPQSGDGLSVGRCLRALRCERGLSIRSLAGQSRLNANTLSLIENNKVSPSVSTLQQIASALAVPITAFFESNTPKKEIAYQKAGHRPRVAFAHGTLEDLADGLPQHGGQPFLVTLEPGASSGDTPIVHTGQELVFCLEGHITYTIDNNRFPLEPGDSLIFEAHLPHCWQNTGASASLSLLILCPADESDHPSEQHFKVE